MSPPFLRQKNITPEIFNKQDFFFDVSCFLFSKREERGLSYIKFVNLLRNTGQSPLSFLSEKKKAADIKKGKLFIRNFWSDVFSSEKRRRHGELKRARTPSILGLHILCHHGRCFALGKHLLKVRTEQLLLCAPEQVRPHLLALASH